MSKATMTVFEKETKAFAAAGDKVSSLSRDGTPVAGLRVLPTEGGYKVLIVPQRGTPFYL